MCLQGLVYRLHSKKTCRDFISRVVNEIMISKQIMRLLGIFPDSWVVQVCV